MSMLVNHMTMTTCTKLKTSKHILCLFYKSCQTRKVTYGLKLTNNNISLIIDNRYALLHHFKASRQTADRSDIMERVNILKECRLLNDRYCGTVALDKKTKN